MATVNKDFKIKSGLIVEGTNGTINGQDILTTSQASIDFIVDVIGGETLITSVESTQLEVVSGELNVKAEVFDDFGSADAAETAANSYTDGEITAALATAQGYADTAEENAGTYTDQEISAEATNRNNAIDQAINTEVTNRNTAISTAKDEAIFDAGTYTDNEITTALTTAQGYADDAEADANSYTDTAISNLNLGTTYDAYGSAATAESNANSYTDTKVADLVNGAPELLDTLNELAAALEDNPDVISDLRDIADGKQNTLTAGNGIDITADTISVAFDAGNGLAINGTNLTVDTNVIATKTYAEGVADDAETAANSYTDGRETAITTAYQSYADTAEADAKSYADGLATNYDAAGSASTAESNANTYTDNAVNALDTDDIEEGAGNLYFTDSRAKSSAADLLTGATLSNITITGTGAGLTITAESGVADATTDDLAEGEENLYFTDERAVDAVSGSDVFPSAVVIANVAKQVAAQVTAATAGIQVAHSFDKTDYRSAEYLIQVTYGTHAEVSKVLLTRDTSDNIAITEYGIVGTNGSASTISAGISGTNVQLLVTTTNNDSTVTVLGTLLV